MEEPEAPPALEPSREAAPAEPNGGNGGASPPPQGGLRGLLWSLSPWGAPLSAEATTRAKRMSVWIVGVLGACVALQVTLLFRFMGMGIFVPEVAAEGVVPYLPPGAEASAIATFGGLAKILGLIAAILAFVAVHAVGAAYRGRLMAAFGLGRKTTMALYTAAPAAATLLVVLPVFGAGMAGADSPAGPVAASATVVLASFLYALVLDSATASFGKSHPQGVDVSRRQLFVASAAAFAIVAMGITGLSAFVTQTGRRIVTSYRALLDGEITPNGEFYKVQKSFVPPMADPSTWEMSVGGLVDNPRTYNTAELLQMSSQEQYHTLECVSNNVGGGLIGNARWSGVPLRKVLEDAGVRSQATWVEFHSLDGYDVGVPLHKAMEDHALLALFMNGDRLPNDHGFPVRALIPGLYGMMNPKWISSINLVDREVVGYWQRQGWTNEGSIRLTSIISLVPMDAHAGATTTVGGVAFAGDREVTRVQVSDDGGATWSEADVKGALEQNAWTLWSYEWTPPRAGRLRLTVRAWEMRGGTEVVQEEMHTPPYPDGATGYDAYEVDVSA